MIKNISLIFHVRKLINRHCQIKVTIAVIIKVTLLYKVDNRDSDLSCLLHDINEFLGLVPLLPGNEGERTALFACSPCPPHPVYILLHVLGEVIVEHIPAEVQCITFL